MKNVWICCFAALCLALSGCAGDRQEVPDGGQRASPQERMPEETSLPEPDPAPEEDPFSGRWQAVESPQYYMNITGGDETGYSIEIVWAGASRGNHVWAASGTYDETWEGVAYVGAVYEDAVNEDGTASRIPVPEREEVTGMVSLEEDGTLCWIDDFDHMGDGLHFAKE